jgi:hypothetical protein
MKLECCCLHTGPTFILVLEGTDLSHQTPDDFNALRCVLLTQYGAGDKIEMGWACGAYG